MRPRRAGERPTRRPAPPAAGRGDDVAYWSGPIEPLLGGLETSPAGLATEEAEARRSRYGPNSVAPTRRAAPLRILAAQFATPITILLALAAIISMVVGDVTEGAIILGILVMSGLLGFFQEYRAADAVTKLLELVQSTATVLRGGREEEIPLADVVPGDVVRLQAGSNVPGDARLLEAKDLFVDESTLTGESFPVEKEVKEAPPDVRLAERRNSVFLGTHVVSGMATAVVVRTGPRTEFGAVAKRLALRPAETEFQLGLRRFGGLLLNITLVMSLVLFAANVALHRPVLDALLFTLALAVGLTPQLLPAIVSVTLARGARHMARERVIVRRLAAIEDLGGMDVLCTDKTGTITEGVVALHGAEDFAGSPSDVVRRYAYLNAALQSGYANPIDEALRASPAAGLEGWAKVDEVPYDFLRKRLSIAVERNGDRLLLTKGALANVLDVCDTVESATGTRRPLAEVRDAIEARYEALSRDGLRCLGVAYRPLPDGRPLSRDDETGLIFVGMLTLSDPLKPGVANVVRELRDLGIGVKIVSGDNRYVAARAGADAGVGAAVLSGSEVSQMSPGALLAAAPRTDVLAEVEPGQKERIILAMKKGGSAVGFLGDGINDAAGLHAADVGISVDSATAVTRDAADVVLLDKDLGVLARGVREGRRTFANTLKYVFISTSSNFGTMLSMAIASCFTSFLPMLPKQILLLNVLGDLPAMAIAGDRVDAELVARPRRWRTDQIRRFMFVFGPVSSLFDFVTFGALLLLAVSPPIFRTAWFLESALSQMLVLLVVRTRRPFFRSRPSRALLAATIGVSVFALALPYLPYTSTLGFAPLPARIVALVFGIVAVYVATAEAVKRIVRGRGVAL